MKLTPSATGVAPIDTGVPVSTLHAPPSAYLSATTSASSSSSSTSTAMGPVAARTPDLDEVVERWAAPG
jgi:hypothetical protein